MKNQISSRQTDKQESNDNDHKGLKFLAWFYCPIVRSVVLTVVFIVALQYEHRLFSLQTLIAALSLFAIVINIVILVVSLIVMVLKGKDKQILIKQLTQTCFAIVIPILVIPILLAIEIAYGYVALRIMEPRLLQQVQQSPNQLFKYGRFDFRQFPGSSRWVIYDESDQVLLPPQQRNKEWWVTTKEDQEADVACLGEAQLIYSHFFIRFDNCS